MVERVKGRLSFSTSWARWVVFGAVGLLLAGWLLNTPAGLLGKADAIGYAVCHRIDARSFFLGERQMPLCVRCSGMYLGAMLGLIYQALLARRSIGAPAKRVIIILGLFVLAFAVDGLNSYLHLPFFMEGIGLYEPNKYLRLFTGTGMGLAIAAALYPAFNQTVWRYADRRPALRNIRSLLGLILVALLLDLLVLTESPLILYPLAWLSALGVLVLLMMIYSIVILTILRLDNQITTNSQLVLVLTGGLGLSIVQIAVLSALRYFLTGTWDGLHLG